MKIAKIITIKKYSSDKNILFISTLQMEQVKTNKKEENILLKITI